MLSIFPQLLFLSPLGVTILRICASVAFAVIAYRMVRDEKKIENTSFVLIGKPASWMVWLSSTISGVIAIALFIGYATQPFSILGALLAAKHLACYRKYHAVLPLSSGTYAFLLATCLMLLVSGAGALAFDLPL